MLNRKAKSAVRGVEDVMPLADFRRDHAVLKNGDVVCYLQIEGENVSLFDTDQKEALAESLASLFAAIKREFTILKYPIEPDVTGQLAFINQAIARERGALASAKTEAEGAEHAAMLSILEEHLLPRARKEATGGKRWELPTWIAIRYPAEEDRDVVERSMSSILNAARAAGLRAKWLDESGMRRLCSLYFTPSGGDVEPERMSSPAVVIASKGGR